MKRVPVYLDCETGGILPWDFNLLEFAFVCGEEGFERKVRATNEGIDPYVMTEFNIDLEQHNREAVPLSRAMRDATVWLDRQCKLHDVDQLTPVGWRPAFDHLWLRRCEFITGTELDDINWKELIDLRAYLLGCGPEMSPDLSLIGTHELYIGGSFEAHSAMGDTHATKRIAEVVDLEATLNH
jgi:hypothetical protein